MPFETVTINDVNMYIKRKKQTKKSLVLLKSEKMNLVFHSEITVIFIAQKHNLGNSFKIF